MLLGAALVRVGPDVVGADCSLVAGGGTVALTLDQARDATMLAATTYRDGRTQESLAGALRPALEDAAGTLTPAQASAALARPGAVDDRLPLARALLGYGEQRLVCRADEGGVDRQPEGPGGLTPRADDARAQVLAAFGPLPVGGFAPGGVRTGHVEGSAHYDGRAVDVFFRPVSDRNRRRGWTTAQWLIARAEPLDLAVVIFDRQLWSVAHADDGWRPYRHPSGATGNAVLDHLDHVHLDVLRGT